MTAILIHVRTVARARTPSMTTAVNVHLALKARTAQKVSTATFPLWIYFVSQVTVLMLINVDLNNMFSNYYRT